MGKIAAYLLVGIGVGLGFAWWQGIGAPDSGLGSGLALDERAPIERRLSELETALTLERYERQMLADELDTLKGTIVSGDATAGAADAQSPRERLAAIAGSDQQGGPIADRIRARFPDGVPQSREEIEAAMAERQMQRFVEAGLAPERAQWILQREDELRMEVLDAQYEARQSGASPEEVASLGVSQLMRAELGDTDYEKYLEGLGRPTSVAVRAVLTNSPAQAAGLAAGDEIVAYNGKRVFDMNELTELTYESRPGESVAIDVIRDGQPMQVYVESGPIGISGGGRSTRRDGFAGGGPGGFPGGGPR